MTRRGPGWLKALALALLLCVLALRVAVPAGYMLDRDASGWPRLVACPAAAPVVMSHAGQSAMPAGHHHHDQKSVDHPCAFAAASAAVDLAALPHDPAVPHVRAADAAMTLHLFARPGLGLAAPPPPKTGPPAAA